MRALSTGTPLVATTLGRLLKECTPLCRSVDFTFMPFRRDNTLLLVPLRNSLIDRFAPFAPSEGELVSWLEEPEVQISFGRFPSSLRGDDNAAPDPADLEALRHDLLTEPGATVDRLKLGLVLNDPSDPSRQGDLFRPELTSPDVKRRRALLLLGVEQPESLADIFDFETKNAPFTGTNHPFNVPEYYEKDLHRAPAAPRSRSVVFVNNCYYNFLYLSRALRARGWDTMTVSLADPASSVNKFFHGEDLNVFSSDPAQLTKNLFDLYRTIRDRFGMVHFYGMGTLSVFPMSQDSSPAHDALPWDLLDWKRNGILVGYSHSGCLDGVSQTSFRRWNGNTLCDRCVYRDNKDVCSDQGNLAWGWKLNTLADLICVETDPPLDFKASDKSFFGPLTFALDPEVWRPDLQPPAEFRQDKGDKILIYHAVGNYDARSKDGVNVKGTGPTLAAIERLQAEGYPVELTFVHDVPSINNRFVQVQADIIVDQLNYGRYGALAREGMMLGKPVVGRLLKQEVDGRDATRCILESPIVSADETTIYDVLKGLVVDPQRRADIGAASRAHALRWWSADVLAERYERVHDIVRSGKPVPFDLDL
jgi:Glycosyltransferase